MNNNFLIELLPLFLMGLLCGFIRFARTENEIINANEDEKKTIKIKRTRFLRGIDIVLTSSITAALAFALLSYFTQLEYLFKIAIAELIALYGIDKILYIVDKLINIKNAKQ